MATGAVAIQGFKGYWLHRTLRAEAPGERLALAVAAAHPELGAFFSAELRARHDSRAARNERAGLATLLRRALKRAASRGSRGLLPQQTATCQATGRLPCGAPLYIWREVVVGGIYRRCCRAPGAGYLHVVPGYSGVLGHTSGSTAGPFCKFPLLGRSRVELMQAQSTRNVQFLCQNHARPCRYGYQPQRIALWIYWQAVVLLCKGARFFPYPDPGFQARVEAAAHNLQCCGGIGSRFAWQPPKDAPWSWDSV